MEAMKTQGCHHDSHLIKSSSEDKEIHMGFFPFVVCELASSISELS